MGIENYRRVVTQDDVIKEDLGLFKKTLFVLRLPSNNCDVIVRKQDYFSIKALLVNIFWRTMAKIIRFQNKILGISNDLQETSNKQRGSLRSENSLVTALKPVIFFGRIIGAVPLLPKFRLSAVIIFMLCINITVEIVGLAWGGPKRKTPFDLAASIGTLWFYFNGAFVYIHFYRNYGKLLLIMKSWTDMRKEFPVPKFYTFAISILILMSAISENIVYHFKLCPVKGENYDFLQCTFNTMHAAWPALLPYHPVAAVYLIITNKLSLYVWNFMDVLIVGLSLGLHSQFKAVASQKPSSDLWPKLREDYDRAMEKLAKVEDFLSPLIFVSYGINMFAMCMQLNLWLTPSKNETLLDSVYSIWSSLHLFARVGCVSYAAAKINEASAEVLLLTRDCPTKHYTLDIYRLEITIQSAHIGLSGLKSFFITKRFLLSIVSVVFTFEVVLLQNFQGC